jgi:hypothetical protein
MKKWLWEVSQKVGAMLLFAAVVGSPVWILTGIYFVQSVYATETRSLENEKQFEQIQQALKYLMVVNGIAVTSDAGDKITASVNTRGAAARFRSGQEIWVMNNSDPSETRIKVKIEGSFRRDPSIILELSKEAAIALKFAESQIDGEIRVAVEPVEVEEIK